MNLQPRSAEDSHLYCVTGPDYNPIVEFRAESYTLARSA